MVGDDEPLPHLLLEDARSRQFDTRAVVTAGLVGGVAFFLVEVFGHALHPEASAWDTPLRIASLLVGSDIQPTSWTWKPGLTVVALVIHAMLSLVYAMLIAMATRSLPKGSATVLGAVFGAVLYLVNHHLIAPLFPAFAGGTGFITLLAHTVFGATAVWVFRAVREASIRAALSRHPA